MAVRCPRESQRAEEPWLLGDLERFGLAIREGAFAKLKATYYDTEDWQLCRAGYALRVRREEGSGSEATMKSLVPAGGNLYRRRKISEPLKSDESETPLAASGPVGACLRSLAETRGVHRILEVRTHRQTFDFVLDIQAVDPNNTQNSGSAGAIWIGAHTRFFRDTTRRWQRSGLSYARRGQDRSFCNVRFL